ncbi:hypothetical protein [Fusibacter ferrireducens]|uniref:Uncharacterized protein n=1 Tax=Fusibacter ferrireducens TaxID=2785058 RepID=A0ABR9ZTK4_9FIRM|nr:hypothetical protein [Fusibacter ferrireducens]MBF4693210.1 hypothetical protein [Fusibacter ferrireducens]
MIKNLSIAFVFLLVCIMTAAISTIFFPAVRLLVVVINAAAVGLLIIGITLIISLIIDRYRDYKNENDDYKKY